MTTFTTEDRILAEKDGSFTINVEGGTVTSPPHIVDSGASVMNNEPVAWIEPDVIPLTHIIKAVVRREQDEQYSIPLYTHPVKELTDEEIMEVATINLGHSMGLLNWMGFAKAILRKASEK